METRVGTPFYMAPEVLEIQKSGHYDAKCDIWSLGVSFYFILFGKIPFWEARSVSKLAELVKVHSGRNLRLPHKINSKIQTLLEGMLEVCPEKRFSFEDVERILFGKGRVSFGSLSDSESTVDSAESHNERAMYSNGSFRTQVANRISLHKYHAELLSFQIAALNRAENLQTGTVFLEYASSIATYGLISLM